MWVPPGFKLGASRITMQCLPLALARHSGVAAWVAISYPFETRFYEVIGLSEFSLLPLVGFCWPGEG